MLNRSKFWKNKMLKDRAWGVHKNRFQNIVLKNRASELGLVVL